MRHRKKRLNKRVRRVVENKPLTFKKSYNYRDPGLTVFDIGTIKDLVLTNKHNNDKLHDILFRKRIPQNYDPSTYTHIYVIFRKKDNEKVVRVYQKFFTKYEVGQINQYGWTVIKIFEQQSLFPLKPNNKTYLQMTYDEFLKTLNSDQLMNFLRLSSKQQNSVNK